MRKTTITLDEQFYTRLEIRAKESGFERVSTFIRFLARQNVHDPLKESFDRKLLQIQVDNYRELFGYVSEKKLGSVETFAVFAMAQYMARNSLTAAQKERAGKSIGVIN